MKQKTTETVSCTLAADDGFSDRVAAPVRTRKSTQYLAGGLATLAALSSGTMLSWSSPGLALLQQPSSTPSLSPEQASWVASLLAVGALLGAVPAGVLADRAGRRTALLLLAPLLVASWLLVAFCSSVWQLYAARLLGGAAVGAVSVVAPVYCAEVAENCNRGALGTFFQLQLSAGILLGYAAGLVGDTSTTLALVLCVLPAAFLVSFPWAPETPAYLASRGREQDAVRALLWLRGPRCDAHAEAKRLTTVVLADHHTPWGRLIARRSTLKALLVVVGLMVFQQFSGVNAVIFFAEPFLRMSGGDMTASAASILVGGVQLAANYASVLLVDRAGRRVLLLFSAVVMALSQGALGAFFYLELHGADLGAASSVAPTACLAAYIVAFSLGFGPVPWMLLGELFAPEVKGLAAAAGAGTAWLFAFVVTTTFLRVVDAVGLGLTFWMYSAVCALSVPFVVLLVPETKGKDLQAIQDELAGRRQTLDAGRPA